MAVDGLDLSLGFVVHLEADEVGVGDLRVVIVDFLNLAVHLQVQRLRVQRWDRVLLRHMNRMMIFGLMMLKINND